MSFHLLSGLGALLALAVSTKYCLFKVLVVSLLTGLFVHPVNGFLQDRYTLHLVSEELNYQLTVH